MNPCTDTSMTSAPIAFFANRDRPQGRSIPTIFRLTSLAFCAGALISAGLAFHFYNSVFTDGEGQVWAAMLLVPGAYTIVWTLIYLALIGSLVSVPYGVTIAFELLAWLFALAFTLAATLATNWGMARKNCRWSTPYCGDWRRVNAAMGVACAFSFVLV